jgi:hypothetical protein
MMMPGETIGCWGACNEDGNRSMAAKKTARAPRKKPVGDRRQFLTTMSADVIKAVKQAAIEDDSNAWEIMEEAARDWLDRRKKSRRKV